MHISTQLCIRVSSTSQQSLGSRRHVIEISSQHSTRRPTSLLIHYFCEYAVQSLPATWRFSAYCTCCSFSGSQLCDAGCLWHVCNPPVWTHHSCFGQRPLPPLCSALQLDHLLLVCCNSLAFPSRVGESS